MQAPLPSKIKQRKRCFIPDKELGRYVYAALNNAIFEDKLSKNTAIMYRRLAHTWGLCTQFEPDLPGGSRYCKIRLDYRFFCVQWFVTILAHEMVHAYQWEVLQCGLDCSEDHNETFYAFVDPLKEVGIPLKEQYNVIEWFATQDIIKI